MQMGFAHQLGKNANILSAAVGRKGSIFVSVCYLFLNRALTAFLSMKSQERRPAWELPLPGFAPRNNWEQTDWRSGNGRGSHPNLGWRPGSASQLCSPCEALAPSKLLSSLPWGHEDGKNSAHLTEFLQSLVRACLPKPRRLTVPQKHNAGYPHNFKLSGGLICFLKESVHYSNTFCNPTY